MLYKAKCRMCEDIIIATGRFELQYKLYQHLLRHHPKIVKQDEQIQRKIEEIRKKKIKPLEEKLKHFETEITYKHSDNEVEI